MKRNIHFKGKVRKTVESKYKHWFHVNFLNIHGKKAKVDVL